MPKENGEKKNYDNSVRMEYVVLALLLSCVAILVILYPVLNIKTGVYPEAGKDVAGLEVDSLGNLSVEDKAWEKLFLEIEKLIVSNDKSLNIEFPDKDKISFQKTGTEEVAAYRLYIEINYKLNDYDILVPFYRSTVLHRQEPEPVAEKEFLKGHSLYTKINTLYRGLLSERENKDLEESLKHINKAFR